MSFHQAWAVLLILTGLFFVGLGVRIKGRPLGILIDSRCKMSLSRLQVVLWSWLLISAFLAVAWATGTVSIEMA